MSDFEVPEAIICSPFEEPTHYWRLEEGAGPHLQRRRHDTDRAVLAHQHDETVGQDVTDNRRRRRVRDPGYGQQRQCGQEPAHGLGGTSATRT